MISCKIETDMDLKIIRAKAARIKKGEKPRVLDLFAGCGGLSLGFHAAGYEIAAALEYNNHAAKSHGTNFHPGSPLHAKARDITQTKPEEFVKELGLGPVTNSFDVIVGGPPCQAFARIGRSKLREVADHPEAYRHDPRSRLYIEYLSYVEACMPLAVVMENVPDIMNHGGHNIAEEVAEVLSSRGYNCRYTLLNAVHYGVPQMRERMFLIGIHSEISEKITFPEPTHSYDLPTGYEGTRNCALKLLNGENSFYTLSPVASENIPPAITTKQAIQDLPIINARKLLSEGLLKRGARRFDDPVKWSGETILCDYGRLMRTWEGFPGTENIYDHVIRYLPRDYELFSRLDPGDQYPQAYEKAELMFKQALRSAEKKSGKIIIKNSDEWNSLRKLIVPPYEPGKFPNKWRKLEADTPSRTLLAHLGKDSYSHIHYDSNQARTISVREAARLQSFPDGFVFCGTMNPAFQQIGNAVPPLLAKAIAQNLRRQILGI